MNERVCSDALVMPSRTGVADAARLPAFCGHRVDLVVLDPVELLALDQLRLAGIRDLDLLQHLANDHLDVLVVDRHALQTVDVLDLVDQVVREFLDALDRQDVVRRRVAVVDEIAALDTVARAGRPSSCRAGSGIRQALRVSSSGLIVDALLVLVVLAEFDGARDFREDRMILRTPGLEEFRNTRQTAGDVARFRRRRRNTGQHVARLHFRAAIDREHGIDRKQVTRIAAARDLDRLALASP